jgi:hypothetical protein
MESKYRYNKMAGALQEAAGDTSILRAPASASLSIAAGDSEEQAAGMPDDAGRFEPLSRARRTLAVAPHREGEIAPAPQSSVDPTRTLGGQGMFHYTIEEGQHVLVVRADGTMEELVGPKRVWRGGRRFRPMVHHVAYPGEFLIVRFRDGKQEHLAGPAHVWFDPRIHLSITKEEALQIAAKEAVVVYSRGEDEEVKRRVVSGPAVFVTAPGEWLHTFSWHGAKGGSQGNRKVANALVFQKLWLLPDQMYHDVTDVRTSDDAVLTIRLMIFFELIDIETMLATSHDPIGDFVNAATSDVVDFLGRHDFESFKQNTERLNDLATYRQLVGRAEQCGYRINKVVYRGYGAPESLQDMHNQAIESRTRLALERATYQQAQELEDFKLEREVLRAARQRGERAVELEQELELTRKRREAELTAEDAKQEIGRRQGLRSAEQRLKLDHERNNEQRAHLEALRALGVDLTALLTQGRADQVIELRGSSAGAHLHVDPRPAPK